MSGHGQRTLTIKGAAQMQLAVVGDEAGAGQHPRGAWHRVGEAAPTGVIGGNWAVAVLIVEGCQVVNALVPRDDARLDQRLVGRLVGGKERRDLGQRRAVRPIGSLQQRGEANGGATIVRDQQFCPLHRCGKGPGEGGGARHKPAVRNAISRAPGLRRGWRWRRSLSACSWLHSNQGTDEATY
jgi:hypothetical protein